MKILKRIFSKTKTTKTIKRICSNCDNQHSEECPNSSLCYSLDNKPYFKERLKDEQKYQF